jgi:hypothetical protein
MKVVSPGYVNATHELLQPRQCEIKILLITATKPTAHLRKERRSVQSKSHADWADHIINDLKKIHHTISGKPIEEINCDGMGTCYGTTTARKLSMET